MKKTLIQLIKNSKLVIITGPIGSGKSLLLTKLAHHSQLGGTIITNKEQLTPLPWNIFIDESFYNDYHQEIYEQGRVVFCYTNLKGIWIGAREEASLIIKTIGVKQRWWFGWEKYLQLEVYPNARWANCDHRTINLPITKQDLTRLDTYSKQQSTEYRQTITKQRNSLNNSEIRI